MRRTISSWPAALCLLGLLAACGAGPGTPAPENLIEQAAAEATAIVQQAQATALVLQARAEASELVAQAGAPAQSTAAPGSLPVATPGPTLVAPEIGSVPTAESLAAAAQVPITATQELAVGAPVTGTVELLGVGFAAEGGFIIVSFRASPRVVQKWWQGAVSVTGEATGTVYNEIPVVPVIGPLIGRPVEEGQLGYVMLVHAPPSLKAGDLVTVVLGDYRFEHVPVE
jgi:hypothetical protein